MAARLPLVLDAEEHNDLGIREGAAEVVGNFDAEIGEPMGHQRRRADEGDGGAELGEGVDVGAGDAAEQNVAEDDNFSAFQRAEVLEHREGIEEALGGMLVGAVAGVDHGDVEELGEVERRAGGGVSEDNHIGAEGADVFRRVAEGFALGGAGAGAVEGDDIGAEALGGHVEGHTGARAGFEEEVDDSLAAQRGNFLHASTKDFFEGGGGGVDLIDLGAGEFLDREKMAAGPGHDGIFDFLISIIWRARGGR